VSAFLATSSYVSTAPYRTVPMKTKPNRVQFHSSLTCIATKGTGRRRAGATQRAIRKGLQRRPLPYFVFSAIVLSLFICAFIVLPSLMERDVTLYHKVSQPPKTAHRRATRSGGQVGWWKCSRVPVQRGRCASERGADFSPQEGGEEKGP
jgi:hypothetical protein